MASATLSSSFRHAWHALRSTTAVVLAALLVTAGAVAVGTPCIALAIQAHRLGPAPALEGWLEAAGEGGLLRGAMASLLVCSAGFSLVLWTSIARRIGAGAGFLSSCRSRFDELPPVRGLIHVGHACLWVVFLGACVAAAFASWQLGSRSIAAGNLVETELPLAGICVSSALVAAWLRRAYRDYIVAVPAVAPPKVEVELQAVEDGIAFGDMRQLGVERFPNRYSSRWIAGLWVRGLLAACLLLAACGATVVQFTRVWQDGPFDGIGRAWRHATAGCIRAATRFEAWRDFAPASLYVAIVLAAMLLRHNRNYLLLSFARSLLVFAALAAVAVLAATCLFPRPDTVAVVFAAACCAMFVRLSVDLVLARRHAKEQAVKAPALARLEQQDDMLRDLLDDPACTLPAVELAQIARRVAHGAANISESDPFVVRQFGRYMRVGRLRKQRCSIAMQRHLAVDRSVVLSNGWATGKPLGGPQVPLWNETLFPLVAPDGYVDRIDSQQLGAEWNVVRICCRCGGSGWVTETETYWETEYYTTYENGQSRSASRQVQRTREVRRTCSCCGGAGRLEHNQILQTHWKHLRTSVVHPPIPLSDLVDGAEEVCLARAVLLEDRARLPHQLESREFAPHLRQRLQAAADEAAARFDEESSAAHAHLGGRLYRAEYSVWAFHTLQVRCAGFSSRVGWFFGRRPEYYFPRLPVGWSRVGTTVFLPPLYAVLLAGMCIAAWYAVAGATGLPHSSLLR